MMLRKNRKAIVLGAIASLVLAACGSDAPVEEELRDDLILTTYSARIDNGLSSPIAFDIPFDVDSFLMEVRGSKGRYFLSELRTPGGRNVVEDASYVTRGAREIPGLVDWLFPNSPDLQAESGTYTLTVRAKEANSENNLAGEDIELLVYAAKRKPSDTCGIQVDFLIDDAALAEGSFGAAVERIVEEMDRNYRQVGIKIANYQTYRMDMQSSGISLGDGSAIRVVDDVLDRAVRLGAARPNAVHVMLVRRVGGTDSPGFDPYGYSMGLPGPYSERRGTSAVLVSTELFANGGNLDADGLASTLTHEIGHFLGLYHTSERNGTNHDPIDDTPECDNEFSCNNDFKRNIMTSSFWLGGADPSTRNRFSQGQGEVMRGHPLCEPMVVDVLPPPVDDCELECTAPSTCALRNSQQTCEVACDPSSSQACEGEESCEPDDLGTYVCFD